MKPDETALPGFDDLFSEIISKTRRKRKRGRPRKYDNPTHRAYLKNRMNFVLGAVIMKKSGKGANLTVRQQQNHIRAERACNILKKAESGAFLVHYFLYRNSLLAGLGRIESKDWLIRTAEYIALKGLKGEAARSQIRKIRFGKAAPRSRWNNHSILFDKIWKAVCQYRNLFHDITDEEILADLETVIGWTKESLKLAAIARERKKAASKQP